MNAVTATATATSTEVGFVALAIRKGKGVTAIQKAENHLNNGAFKGALMAQSIGRKAIVDDMATEGMMLTVHALSVGNIRPAMALIIAKWGKPYSMLTESGKAPYSEWLRLGATLGTEKRTNAAGKLTPAGKSYDLFQHLSAQSASLRESREQAKIST